MKSRGIFGLLLLLVLAPVLARSQGQSTACKSNLKNIATALEMYSTDFNGTYPAKLSQLTPSYIKTIPECPGAGRDTYSLSYFRHAKPDLYSVYCQGSNHVDVEYSPNTPAYDVCNGLHDERKIKVTVEECESAILANVDKLKKHHADHGSYPAELKQLSDPILPHGSYLYFPEDDGFTIRCSGAFHVSQGGQAFFPSYKSESGLQKKSVDVAPWKKKTSSPWPKVIAGLGLCGLLIWAVLGGKKEPEADLL